MPIRYGIEKFGKLQSVLLHRPEVSILKINNNNAKYFLFDSVPNIEKYLEEHQRYAALLEHNGVTVYELSALVTKNAELLEYLPNLAYLHDIAVISTKGAMLSKMASQGRSHEELVIKEALFKLGIPMLYEPNEGDVFEGCLLLDADTVFVANTERHNSQSIERFISFILTYFKQVVYAVIPKERRYMHPDMVIGRMTPSLYVYYPPAFLNTYVATKAGITQIEIKDWMKKHHVELFPLAEEEQKRWGTSFVALEPGVVVNYDISLEQKTVNSLEREGVRFIHFHPQALLAGGGSLRCLTMRLFRQ